MRTIGTPAFRLTADCIWTSFQSSAKRHLIITGGRKAGKSTLFSQLPVQPLPGLLSRTQAGKAVYLRDSQSGQEAQIGIFDPSLPGEENKMRLCAEGFLAMGIPALRRCAEEGGQWASIDEIGYLESGCQAYCDAILQLMERKRLIAVLRKQDTPFLTALRRREDVFLVDLDQPFGQLGCVIMASGLGKRFGGNKLMADFQGRPLICRTLDATEGIFARRVVVTRHKEIQELCLRQGIQVLFHDLPFRSDTVRLGLEQMDESVEGCAFFPGDQPLLRWDSAAALALNAVNEKTLIWRCAYGGTPGSPVLFPRWTFGELLNLPQGKGGNFVAKKYPQQLGMTAVRDRDELRDVDRPEDLRELLERQA